MMPAPTVQQTFELAVQHHQARRTREAEELYRQVLAREPDHAESLYLLGSLAAESGQFDAAEDFIRQLIALEPDFAEAYPILGIALKGKGQLDESIAAYRRSIELGHRSGDTFYNLGNALRANGQNEDALAAYRLAVALNPGFPEAHANQAGAAKEAGHMEEAITAYQRAFVLKPDLPDVANHLSFLLAQIGQFDEAIAIFRQIVAQNPDHAEAHNNLGAGLQAAGRMDEAIAAFSQAVALKPDLAEAHDNLGQILQTQKRLDEAVAEFRKAIALRSDLPLAFDHLGYSLKEKGQLDQAIAAFRQAVALRRDYTYAHSNLIIAMYYHPRFDASAIAQELRNWRRQHAESLERHIAPHPNDRDPDRRLRIGYVSPDLGNHPVGWFMLPLLEHHNYEEFEIYCYAQPADSNPFTRQLRSHVSVWRNLTPERDDRLAEIIRADKIDILVDLSLHSGNHRLLTFARKPAPVQATYLAYAGSSGLATMDYRLTDPYLDPPGEDDSVYTEKTIRLRETYWRFKPVIEPPLQPLPALSNGYVTFGCFNNFCKINEPLLEIWARLLAGAPRSRLVLHALEGDHRRRVLDYLKSRGVDSDRVAFSGRLTLGKYFDQYQSIDIALDTHPFGGGTTTCDTLWMGVPVVSLAGKTAVGRAGLSILTNVGLPELVAKTPEDYVSIARGLASDLSRLEKLRSTMRQRMAASPLMDAPRFARHVESAYRQMWRTWVASA